MNGQSLLDKAKDNLDVAGLILDHWGGDDSKINLAGYHLQQAVEFYITHTLEVNGVEYKQSHDISALLTQCEEADLTFPGFDYLDDRSEMFTSWEAKTRYIKDYLVQRRKVVSAYEHVSSILTKAIAQEQEIEESEAGEDEPEL